MSRYRCSPRTLFVLVLAALSSAASAACEGAATIPPSVVDAAGGHADAGAPRDGGPADAGDAGDSGDAGAFHPAPHPPAPRVITHGGSVLQSPKIVLITYDGDAMRAQIEAFTAALGASEFWKAVTAEYGVGPATLGRPVHLSEPPPAQIDDVDVKAWFQDKLDGSHPDFDLPDGNTMYALYFPETTTYVLDGAPAGGAGCSVFGASDNLGELPDGTRVPYIVIPRCPPQPGLDAWNSLAAVSSHEFYEEATDPFKDAYVTNDDDHLEWALSPPFSEIGDMCIYDPNLFITPDDVGAAVQRAWSNEAALAGHDPCVPAPAGAYFNAAPVLEDEVSIGGPFGWKGKTKGVHVPVGQTRTIDVALFSDVPTDPWRVRVFDAAALAGRPAELALALDRSEGQNGDVLKLTITTLLAGKGGGSRFYVVSDTDPTHLGFWVGYVGN